MASPVVLEGLVDPADLWPLLPVLPGLWVLRSQSLPWVLPVQSGRRGLPNQTHLWDLGDLAQG